MGEIQDWHRSQELRIRALELAVSYGAQSAKEIVETADRFFLFIDCNDTPETDEEEATNGK